MNQSLKISVIVCITVCAALLTTGCAVKARKAGGYMDTPETHYREGMKFWNMDSCKQAEEEFTLAKSLDRKYAPAIAGLALTTAKKAQSEPDKKAMEKGFKAAVELADQAQSLNSKIPEPYIAKALVLTMQHEGRDSVDKWIGEVEKNCEKAIKIAPQDPSGYYYRGLCYKKAYVFSKAEADFKKVLELGKDFTAEADEQWAIVQKIQRAAPGTEVGKRIALVDKISRSDIAALFISELGIDKLVQKRRKLPENTSYQAPGDPRALQADTLKSMAAVTDINDHWARNFILDIVNLSIRGLEPYPDHTFRPNDLVNRGEYAMMVEDVLIAILGDQSLATKYIGEAKSRFPDVNPSHPAYNAICNSVDKNIMDAELNGAFGPEKSVSGPDALLVIRKIKELNKL